MKSQIAILTALLFASSALAADIALTDGRVLKDATITSQSPRTVMVKHAAGLTSIAKTLLPAELRAKYPVDETAALLSDQRAAEAKIAAQKFQQREADRAAEIRTLRSQQTEPESEADLAKKAPSIKARARNLVEAHFEQAYKNPGKSVYLFVTVTELTPIDNWPGHWRVIGNTRITISDTVASPGASSTWPYDTSPIGDAEWRKFHNDSQTSSIGPTFYTPPKPQTQNTYPSSSETKNFEAIYAEHPEKPTIDIRVN